jgi:hypothetical protein
MDRTGIRRRALAAVSALATLATLLYTIGAPWDSH